MSIEHRYRLLLTFGSRQSRWVNAITDKEFKLPSGVDLTVQIAVRENRYPLNLCSLSDLTSIELQIKNYNGSPPAASDPVVAGPFPGTIDNANLTLSDWFNDASQHVTFSIADDESNIPPGTYWLVLAGLKSNGDTISVAWGDFEVEEDGTGPTTIVQPASVGYNATSIRGVDIDESVDTPADGDILVYRDAGSDYVLEQKSVGGSSDATSIQGTNVDPSVGSPSDGDIMVYRSAGNDFVLETKPSGASSTNLSWNAASSTVSSDTGTDAVLTEVDGSNAGLMSVADKSKLDSISGTNTGDEPAASTTVPGVSELATSAEINTGTDNTRTITPAGLAGSALQTKVDGIEAGATADQTNAEIVAAVDSELGQSTWKTQATKALLNLDTTDNVIFANLELGSDGTLTFDEHASAPGTPASGKIVVYAKSDGKLYIKDDAGTETDLTNTGGAGGDALTANPLSQFASTTSAQLAGVISDETGSGSLVFAVSPTFVTGITVNGNIAVTGTVDGEDIAAVAATANSAIQTNDTAILNAVELNASGHIEIADHSTSPSNPPANGLVFYVKSGELLNKNSSGTVTNMSSLIENSIQEDSTGSSVQNFKIANTSNQNGELVLGNYQTSSPPTPATGTVVLYSKNGTDLYLKNDAGTITQIV